jgi:hypothetical protein
VGGKKGISQVGFIQAVKTEPSARAFKGVNILRDPIRVNGVHDIREFYFTIERNVSHPLHHPTALIRAAMSSSVSVP